MRFTGWLLLVALLAPGPLMAGPLSQGRMTVGLGGGGGPGHVTVGASFGYFVIDQLRPAIAVSYTWQDFDFAQTHEVDTELSLRYYVLDLTTAPISPFIEANGGVIWLGYRGSSLDGDYAFGSLGGLGGVLFMVGPHFGIEAFAGVISYHGVDQALLDREVVPEVDFRWGFGFSVLF
jgi:hypothetical protein